MKEEIFKTISFHSLITLGIHLSWCRWRRKKNSKGFRSRFWLHRNFWSLCQVHSETFGYGGHSMTTWTQLCPFLTSTWTFLTLNVDKNSHFWTTSSCPLLTALTIDIGFPVSRVLINKMHSSANVSNFVNDFTKY